MWQILSGACANGWGRDHSSYLFWFFCGTQSSFWHVNSWPLKTHLCCWGSCCFRSPKASWTRCCKWSLRGEHNIGQLWAYSTVSAPSPDDYLLHCEVHQGSAAHVTLGGGGGLSSTAGIISGDFPQPEMIGRWVDNRAWLVISRTGSLNTDRPGPQRGCSLRASLFISSDNITQCAPVKAPSFIAYSDS